MSFNSLFLAVPPYKQVRQTSINTQTFHTSLIISLFPLRKHDNSVQLLRKHWATCICFPIQLVLCQVSSNRKLSSQHFCDFQSYFSSFSQCLRHLEGEGTVPVGVRWRKSYVEINGIELGHQSLSVCETEKPFLPSFYFFSL